MDNPFAKKPDDLAPLRQQLLDEANGRAAYSDEFSGCLENLDKLDKIQKRSSEMKKALVASAGTIGGVAAIYALQQFAGVIVPKALEALANRHAQKSLFE